MILVPSAVISALDGVITSWVTSPRSTSVTLTSGARSMTVSSPATATRSVPPTAAISGASLVLFTVRSNSASTLWPAASVAVTLTDTVPTSPFSGVPEKVPVSGSKASQAGRAVSSACVAASVRFSTPPSSAKASEGTAKVKAASSSVACAAMP